MAAGDLRQQYRAHTAITVTGLQSLATSATWLAGWTSALISNATNLDLDNVVSGQITVGAAPTAGEIRAYLYTRLTDAAWPDLFSAGTAGTEGAVTLHDTEIRDSGLYLLWSQVTDATASRVYTMPQTSLLTRIGFMPHEYAIYAAHSTVQALAAAGNAFYVKGISANVAQS